MSDNEAIRLGEEIRLRLDDFKQRSPENELSFDDLLNEIKSKKTIAETQNRDGLFIDVENYFLSSTWAEKIKEAFLIEQFGITLKTFDTLNEMQEYISRYNVETVEGNSYIIKLEQHRYEIGMYKFDILGFIHELGHIVQNNEINNNTLLWDGTEQSDEELSIRKFARSFWMPKKIFEEVSVKFSNHGICDVNQVAKFFAVDFIQAFLRGKELCYW